MPEDRYDPQLTAWRQLHRQLGREGRRPRRRPRRKDVRFLLLAAVGLAVLVTPLAVARDGRPIIQGERNAGTQETAIVTNAGNNAQSTRQSNQAPGGRAAGYGCENDGTTEINACANYVNRGQGPAAAFRTRGQVPFVIRDTNRGRVEHLNADLLDDRDGEQYGPDFWALVDVDGQNAQIVRGEGATEVTRANQGTYSVKFGEENLSECSYQVTPAENEANLTVSAVLTPNDNTRTNVSLRNAQQNQPADGDFNLAVHC